MCSSFFCLSTRSFPPSTSQSCQPGRRDEWANHFKKFKSFLHSRPTTSCKCDPVALSHANKKMRCLKKKSTMEDVSSTEKCCRASRGKISEDDKRSSVRTVNIDFPAGSTTLHSPECRISNTFHSRGLMPGSTNGERKERKGGKRGAVSIRIFTILVCAVCSPYRAVEKVFPGQSWFSWYGLLCVRSFSMLLLPRSPHTIVISVQPYKMLM